MSAETICVSWLEEIQQGIHQPGDTYKIAGPHDSGLFGDE